MCLLDSKDYWNFRGNLSYQYKGETFYTVTPIPFYYRRRSLLIDLIKPYIMNYTVKDVCDFGCGDGWYIHHFGSLYPEKQYYGVDISLSMIERAKQIAPFAKLRVSQKGIDFENTFDLIYAIAVFAHIQDNLIPEVFANIYKRLKIGGSFIIFEQTGPKRLDGETWYRRTTKEYIGFATSLGFDIEKQCLIAFPWHRFFEKWIVPCFLRLFITGRNYGERCINANQSVLFKMMSNAALCITRKPIRLDNGRQDGNSFYVFKKV